MKVLKVEMFAPMPSPAWRPGQTAMWMGNELGEIIESRYELQSGGRLVVMMSVLLNEGTEQFINEMCNVKGIFKSLSVELSIP